jgi:hypothetical protein
MTSLETLKFLPATLIIIGGLTLFAVHAARVIEGLERPVRIVPSLFILAGGIGLLVFHLAVP